MEHAGAVRRGGPRERSTKAWKRAEACSGKRRQVGRMRGACGEDDEGGREEYEVNGGAYKRMRCRHGLLVLGKNSGGSSRSTLALAPPDCAWTRRARTRSAMLGSLQVSPAPCSLPLSLDPRADLFPYLAQPPPDSPPPPRPDPLLGRPRLPLPRSPRLQVQRVWPHHPGRVRRRGRLPRVQVPDLVLGGGRARQGEGLPSEGQAVPDQSQWCASPFSCPTGETQADRDRSTPQR